LSEEKPQARKASALAIRSRWLVRFLVFAGLWWVLTEGDATKPWLGLGGAALATMFSLVFWPHRSWQWSLRGAAAFWPYFLWQSLIGGIDVARRALAPSMPLQPAVITLELRLESAPASVFLAWTIGLLPGTASVHLSDRLLQIHVLDERLPIAARVRQVEEKVALLFHQQLRS
jgi:multicomponent Na+:H+ antiporter subunit E